MPIFLKQGNTYIVPEVIDTLSRPNVEIMIAILESNGTKTEEQVIAEIESKQANNG